MAINGRKKTDTVTITTPVQKSIPRNPGQKLVSLAAGRDGSPHRQLLNTKSLRGRAGSPRLAQVSSELAALGRVLSQAN